MLWGRAREQAAIEALLDRGRAGSGGGLLLHGEPGIGKTALLEYAVERADGMRVLRAAGVEPESDLGYAALHRLLLPVLGSMQRLSEPQARALGVVFGRAEGYAPDRFLVALATLSLLSDVAGERSLLCLIDDVHWVDAPSLDVLAFVARRLAAEPIALALAARADEGRAVTMAGVAELPLAGLDADAARALLAEHGGGELTAAEQDELLAASGGNPLAIRELPATGWRPIRPAAPLPLAAGLQRAFLDRARRRDPDTQRLLLLIAADGSGRVDTIRRAAMAGDIDPGVLAFGRIDDLVATDGPQLTFRHPLMRSAVYHGADGPQRRAAHRALAAVLEDQLDRRAWHLGQAADGPDEHAAGELERSAEHASRRAGPAAAATALERAAELSLSDTDRARRWVSAATAWWQGGDLRRATALLDLADRTGQPAETVRLDIALLRALTELLAGVPGDALALLRPVLADALATDRQRAIRLLMLYGEAGFRSNTVEPWAHIAALLEPLPLAGDDDADVLTRLLRGACRARVGVQPGLAPGDLASVERLSDPINLSHAGGLAWGLGDYDLGRRLRRKAIERARTLGAAGTLAYSLESLVLDELARGRFGTAEAYAVEGYRFAVETGQPNTACRHQSQLAVLAAVRGRDAEARELACEVLAAAAERDLADAAAAAYRALGLLELAAGRHDEAVYRFRAMTSGRANSGLALNAVSDLIEAAVRAGLPQLAAEPLAQFTAWAEPTGSPQLRALCARCRALLADTGAEPEFRLALDLHAQADQPMEQARTELLFGQYLRRERRRSEARPYFRAAVETFRRLGAPVWAELAEGELRATGETARRREPSSLPTLTAQETRIVAAVAEGATNREVAAQLFLSPRTVDYHLRKVFQKLGISSRAELIRHTLVQGETDVRTVDLSARNA